MIAEKAGLDLQKSMRFPVTAGVTYPIVVHVRLPRQSQPSPPQCQPLQMQSSFPELYNQLSASISWAPS